MKPGRWRSSRAAGAGRWVQTASRSWTSAALMCRRSTINIFWWYQADRDLATKIVQTQDEGLSKWCAAHPDRFVAFTSPALQFPDLAAEQLEHAVKQLGMRGSRFRCRSTIRSGPRRRS